MYDGYCIDDAELEGRHVFEVSFVAEESYLHGKAQIVVGGSLWRTMWGF